MKRILFLTTLIAMVMLSSCKKEANIDTTLIPGKWKTGTVYYVFENSGLGHTWDTADDVTEDEAQQLSWEVSGNSMTIYHYGEMGEMIPKYYTINSLTNTTMVLADDYGNLTTLSRIE